MTSVDAVIRAVIDFALGRKFLVLAIGATVLVWGRLSLHRLSFDAYADITDTHVQVITQWPGHSPEEIEQQITIPIESGVNGVAHLNDFRSTSVFGLSVVDLVFDDVIDNLVARQQVSARLVDLDLPPDTHPRLGPDYSPIGQIYFYTLTSSNSQYDVAELKALQEQYLVHQLKSVPNVADVTTFGGTTRAYEVQVDPGKLLSCGLSLSQVEQALRSNNVSGAGSFIERGEQSYNVRAIGHFENANDIGAIVLKSQSAPLIRVRDVAAVKEAPKIRLGQAGKAIRRTDGQIVDEDDVVEGIVLLRKGADLESTISAVEQKVGELNLNAMPPGVRIVPYMNRGDLVQSARKTALDNATIAILLVIGILLLFLRNIRGVFVVLLAIPFSVSFTLISLNLWHIPARLFSFEALDFGMLVAGAVVMVENILQHISSRAESGPPIAERIKIAAHQVRRPVFYATAILIAVHVPILVLERLEGKLFRPMAWTVIVALLGALFFSLMWAPVLACLLFRQEVKERRNHWPVSFIAHSWLTACVLAGCFAGALFLVFTGAIGSEFLFHIDEGRIWAQETLPASIGPTKAAGLMQQARTILASYPEVAEVVSQTGRPDDGTNATGFFTAEYIVNLKPHDQWRSQFRTRDQLIAALQADLRQQMFGTTWNFSQPIQARVEEMITGVKSPFAVKLFGSDLRVLQQKSDEVVRVLGKVPGIEDVGLLRVGGQPNVNVVVDRMKTDRFGINPSDVQDAIEAAMGGNSVAQVLKGDRHFDIVVRYREPYRQTAQDIPRVVLLAPSGAQVALSDLSSVKLEDGVSAIFREVGSRYLAIQYSVGGRDAISTVDQAMKAVAQQVNLPEGYRLDWTGEYQNQKRAQARLIIIASITILVILLIAYWTFHSLKRALLVLADVGLAVRHGSTQPKSIRG